MLITLRLHLFMLFMVLISSTQAFAEEEKDEPAEAAISAPTTPSYFKSVSRLQYRMAINGESGFSQGTFLILPEGFTLAEMVELLTKPHDENVVNFVNYDMEIKLARYMYTESDWGKALGWVIRGQSVSDFPFTASGGLQWNISETPVISRSTAEIPWKSLLQVFVKNKDKFGLIDLYHWYQFPLVKENKLYLRGANIIYFMHDTYSYISIMQDIIYPVNSRLELFTRHFYQNKEIFGHKKGSQFAIGVRIAY